jgi:hypothetical protein
MEPSPNSTLYFQPFWTKPSPVSALLRRGEQEKYEYPLTHAGHLPD